MGLNGQGGGDHLLGTIRNHKEEMREEKPSWKSEIWSLMIREGLQETLHCFPPLLLWKIKIPLPSLFVCATASPVWIAVSHHLNLPRYVISNLFIDSVLWAGSFIELTYLRVECMLFVDCCCPHTMQFIDQSPSLLPPPGWQKKFCHYYFCP